ncbi:nucleoside phosphorylase domain-containing protein [Aspergillus multicolor]|uniref:5'-methylthioadenosine/S-adenosylhomocysteine nucleosidase family protein n=1 Tax=Aspergillus multicolor TaxID=41759 RepID=UPI003CCE3918
MYRAEDYTVGWVSALPVELAAAAEMLDEEHPELPHDPSDDNIYTLGRIGSHNVVIACLPAGRYGTTSAATVAIQMRAKFPAIRFGLMVGVGGGVPSATDVRLGDVVVSQPSADHGGVVQYDSGTATASGFVRKGFLNAPPPILLNSLSKLRSNHLRHRSKVMDHLSVFESLPRFQRENAGVDRLFESTYIHAGGPVCEECDDDHTVTRAPRTHEPVEVHYGTIASGNQVIRNAETRDQLSAELGGVLCFEMEAAGLMNGFPCLVIRGICDYCDSHKNKDWQPFAAATAVAYAKDLLSVVPTAMTVQVLTEQRTSAAFHSKRVGVRSMQASNIAVTTQRARLFDASEITNMAQLAYALYSSLRRCGEASSTVHELSDVLFSLHCSLNHLTKCIRDGGLSKSYSGSMTSNVFKRPDILISRCSERLEQLQALVETSPWTPNPSSLKQLHGEMQWCLSSIDILLDSLLRPDRRSPSKAETESVHTGPQPPPLLYRAMGQVIKPLDRTKHNPSSIGYGASWVPNTPDASLLRSISGRDSILPFTVPEPNHIDIPEERHITIPGAIGIDIPRPVSIDRSTSNIPMHTRFRVEDRTVSREIPSPQSRPSDLPPFTSSTSPEAWLSTIRRQLVAWETANLPSSTKRARRNYLIRALTSLNNYISSVDDVADRRRLRDELEKYGFLQVVVNMKAAVGDLVMLEKQVEVYFDDKMDDGVAY